MSDAVKCFLDLKEIADRINLLPEEHKRVLAKVIRKYLGETLEEMERLLDKSQKKNG